MRKPGVHF